MGVLDRITADPARSSAANPSCVGMRISVELILSLLAQGETQKAILAYAYAVVADDRLEDVAVASG
jgi:uncharacterized protein (DUF433 family)